MLTTDASPRSREINWDYIGDAVPAFLTLIIIPLTYKYVLLLFYPHPASQR